MSEDFYCDEVLSGKTPVEKVFETENVLAYHHTRPFWPVHIVVVPKRHVATIFEAGDDLLLELMSVATKVAEVVLEENGAARILTNLGEYQESKHLHFHVTSGNRFESSL